MNTLRILRGTDISIYVDDSLLCFVTSFVAKESQDVYRIEEFLSDTAVDTVTMRKTYELTITALTHLDDSVFDKEKFTLSVRDHNAVYEYINCRLKSKKRDADSHKPIVDVYTIVATDMRTTEG